MFLKTTTETSQQRQLNTAANTAEVENTLMDMRVTTEDGAGIDEDTKRFKGIS